MRFKKSMLIVLPVYAALWAVHLSSRHFPSPHGKVVFFATALLLFISTIGIIAWFLAMVLRADIKHMHQLNWESHRRCGRCGYPRERGQERCPECGVEFDKSDEATE